MRQLKVLELFSGTRSIGKAFERKGHEVYSIDWDQQHQASWYTDIEKVRPQDILKRFGRPDVIWASPDCFTAGHLVWTSDGYKNIEDVRCGDYVLTHTGNMRKVTRFFKKSDWRLYSVKIAGCETMTVTPEHPFYARKKTRKWFSRNEARYVLGEPEWINAENLTNQYRVGIPINQNSIIPTWDGVVKQCNNSYGITSQWIENELGHLMDNDDFWWIVGRYFGDGSVSSNKYIVDICCNKIGIESNEIRQRLDGTCIKYSERDTETAHNFSISSKELCAFLEQFGIGAANKAITPTILDLPNDLLLQFLDGYVSADGHWDFRGKVPVCTISTVSKSLAYGFQQAILKVFGCYGSMVTRTVGNTILGREVNTKKAYAVSFRINGMRQYYAIEDGMAWVNVSRVERLKANGYKSVYTLSVEDDESFTVSNIAVHNCTTFSVAAISHHRELDKVLGGGASKDPIRAEVRPHGPERDKAHSRAQADGVVHREPARHDEEDAVDAMGSATHGHILPVRRHTDASNRHLVQRAGPRIQASVQERRPMPREGASRC